MLTLVVGVSQASSAPAGLLDSLSYRHRHTCVFPSLTLVLTVLPPLYSVFLSSMHPGCVSSSLALARRCASQRGYE